MFSFLYSAKNNPEGAKMFLRQLSEISPKLTLLEDILKTKPTPAFLGFTEKLMELSKPKDLEAQEVTNRVQKAIGEINGAISILLQNQLYYLSVQKVAKELSEKLIDAEGQLVDDVFIVELQAQIGPNKKLDIGSYNGFLRHQLESLRQNYVLCQTLMSIGKTTDSKTDNSTTNKKLALQALLEPLRQTGTEDCYVIGPAIFTQYERPEIMMGHFKSILEEKKIKLYKQFSNSFLMGILPKQDTSTKLFDKWQVGLSGKIITQQIGGQMTKPCKEYMGL